MSPSLLGSSDCKLWVFQKTAILCWYFHISYFFCNFICIWFKLHFQADRFSFVSYTLIFVSQLLLWDTRFCKMSCGCSVGSQKETALLHACKRNNRCRAMNHQWISEEWCDCTLIMMLICIYIVTQGQMN